MLEPATTNGSNARAALSQASSPVRSDEPGDRVGAPSPESDRCGAMVGSSPVMRRLFDQIERVAPTDAAVLLLGESGTGKELAAEAVHRLSRRSAKAMIALNCGAIPASLVESELFGHERGSFTGANGVHRGHFERADGGTLFLDEICEMPLELQVKLLRVLESGTVQRLGGDRPLRINVRVVAAAKPELNATVAAGRFRADLYYRLNVFPITMPPLRDRVGDIARIAAYFLARMNFAHGAEKVLTKAALERLEAHDWPGNVRELKHALERAYILSDAEVEVDARFDHPRGATSPNPHEPWATLGDGEPRVPALAEVERQAILSTLAFVRGDKKEAARLLRISLKTLYTRLREYRATQPSP